MKELSVKRSVIISSPTERVWLVLTEPEFTKQYMFGCIPVTDWKTGSPLNWKGATNDVIYVKGNIVKILPGRLLQYTIFNPNAERHYSDKPSDLVTVTIELSEENKQSTKLSLTEGNFAPLEDGEKRYLNSDRNWNTVLPKIVELAERKSG